jgi:hypothetical protein
MGFGSYFVFICRVIRVLRSAEFRYFNALTGFSNCSVFINGYRQI